MTLEYQIVLAVILDRLIGDPRWFPHPVRFIGRFAMWLEAPMRDRIASPRLAGAATVAAVAAATFAVTGVLVWGAGLMSPVAGDIVSLLVIYSGIAARDLVKHSTAVYRALAEGDLYGARQGVSMICGRDTDRLDEAGAVRATVESVAENMVDGVTAPLFFAVIGGPVGIMLYKAVNTLDSTFGYKNERYALFGRASARLDDLVNFIPARLTGLMVPIGARILGMRSDSSWRIFLRDRGKHPSPNAGQTEAAVAGALGLQLGGLSYYGGIPSEKPTLGDPCEAPVADHIGRANRLMLVTSGLFLCFMLILRVLVLL